MNGFTAISKYIYTYTLRNFLCLCHNATAFVKLEQINYHCLINLPYTHVRPYTNNMMFNKDQAWGTA